MNRVDEEGNVWKPFVVGYETSEGPRLTFVYAISAEHAQLVIEDLRSSARLVGEVVERKDENE